jgi:hypothetical protein
MDVMEKKTSGKSRAKRASPSRKLKDIKMEVGDDTTALLGFMKAPAEGRKRLSPVKIKQTSLGEHQDPEFHRIDIPESEVISVRKRPDMGSLIEVEDFSELKKVGKTFKFINRYEDNGEVIYFVGGYFYRVCK